MMSSRTGLRKRTAGLIYAGLLALAVGCLAWAGYWQLSSGSIPEQAEPAVAPARSADSPAAHSVDSPAVEPAAPERVLRHDFGILKPRQKVSHRFRIENTSNHPWTFAKFRTVCACTVGAASAHAILPGKAEEVEVRYSAPGNTMDDRRRVGVEFAEEETPMIWLEVRAHVRDPLTVSPPEVLFQRVGKGQPAEASLEIFNYTDHDVNTLTVTSFCPWLRTEIQVVQGTETPYAPRQAWRVTVRAETNSLAYGRQQAQLEVKTAPGELPVKTVPVRLVLTSPVEAIPAQMFFGPVTSGVLANHKILLQFVSDASLEADSIILKHDLGDQLKLGYSRVSPNHWELTATLLPAEPGKIVRGAIDVAFRGGNLPGLRIPVYAKVNPK